MVSRFRKDLYNAQYRLFDHRVFVNGEVEAFLTDFETERRDSEVDSLFKVTEKVGALKYQLSDRCISQSIAHINSLSTELQSVADKITDILESVKKEKPPSEELVQARLERAKRRDNFESDLKYNYQRLDVSFITKEEEIAELYSDLQLKLNIPN
ncbi:biogenesis of lysosome-related organelles complex 1 subunit 5 [Glossina fuscipes fuscipes]